MNGPSPAAQNDDDNGQHIVIRGSGQAQMPVLKQGYQSNFFGVAKNVDIELSLRKPFDNSVEPGHQLVLTAQIVNHSLTTEYRLTLTVRGIPKAVSTIEPRVLTVEPDSQRTARLTISPGTTEPDAGKAEVRIVAQAGGESSPGYSWESEVQEITICAAPGLELLESTPFEYVGGRVHRATVTIYNGGNTQQTGTIVVAAKPGIEAAVDQPAYDLDPGASTAPISVDVRLLQERWWKSSHSISIDVRPTERTSQPLRVSQAGLKLTLVESGLLLDFGVQARSAFRLVKDVGKRTWTRSGAQFPGSWRSVLAAALAALVFGVLAGAWMPKSGESTADRAIASNTIAITPPSSTTPTQPYPEPVQLTATDLPCGEWIVFLAQSADRDPLGSFLRVAAQARLTGKLSRLSYAYGDGRCGTRSASPWILYIGPYESQEDAIAASAVSGVPNSYTIRLKSG